MEEESEYKKLPVDDRCVHKLWKARVDGYEEAAKIFRQIDDEKSPEWNKFLGLIKKFVTDSNAVAQEKGLEATLIFVENCGHAGKTVGEVISGIVTKCIAAPKAKTKDLSVQIALMYIEIEKHEAVVDELIKAFDHKNPKIVASCISTITLALKEFGIKVVNIKPIIKKLPALLSDRDKNVRDEAKTLCIEIYRWIGAALKPQIASLPPVLVTELEAEFEKITAKATPTRYLRSQQEKQAAIAVNVQNEDVNEVDAGETEQEEIDPMDLIDPVDILSKLPKDFYEKLESKKWQERKESLEALETLLQSPKLETGDYGDVIRALKKVLTKDSNVVLVAMAGKCMAGLAKGLGKKFQPYALVCVSAILEKFKEKKPNVVTALRDAIDAIYPATNLEAIQEDILEALNNKNPSVKAETASFLARAFTKTLPTVLNKKLLKTYITALLKTINESDPSVRDASADAIGTAKKLVGEKTISPFLIDVDALKLAKINECCEKSVIVVKIPNTKKERPSTAPAKPPVAATTAKTSSSEASRPVTRPATATITKKAAVKKPGTSTSGNNVGGLAKSASSAKALPTERDMSPEEVDERASEVLPSEVIQGLADSNWKTRLSAVETFISVVNEISDSPALSQVLIRALAKKPGLKDLHFQVLKLKLDLVKLIIEKLNTTITATDYIITDIVEKLGDTKNNSGATQVLLSMAETLKLDYVVSKCMEFAFEQKSPKVQQEALIWVNNAIKEFGFQVQPKPLIEDTKKALQLTNPLVRAAAISLVGTMHLYMGNTLSMFFENEKPAIKQQLQTEFENNAGQSAPQPIRGLKAGESQVSLNDDNEDDGGGGSAPEPQINISDLLPRIDISGQITESLLVEMADKNWKTRHEGLTKLQNILNDAKIIKSNLGDLPLPLSQRLSDSNVKIAQLALAICEQLATAIGPSCKQHVRTFLPGILNGLGDNKSFLRQASISCMNVWCEQGGYKEFFECEMIADALKSGSPALRIELWGWLAEKLPKIPLKSISKEDLQACLPILYANICDRNADVRKNSNEAILGFMIHLGFEGMMKALDKQKPATKKDIQAALEKARPNLPVKPLPKNKQQAPILQEEKSVKSGAVGNKIRPSSANVKNTAAPTNANVSRNKKEEEVDNSPLLAVNNLKNQRVIDEQKLRVLKWTFTTPREEFNELLKEQMMTANVNKMLMANMFHEDFRYHLKVIDSLSEDLQANEKALVCNLDLVLKWLSLRFYDTNPSVLLKSLDYIYVIFVMLANSNQALSEHEGSIFLPHLLLKIGDPKDAVRNGVRKIIRQVCFIHPITKIFAHLMEGLKSKNARQRTECLEELGYLISEYTLVICVPTQQAALKEIAKHISDRDNSVRSAALNCIVQAYFLAGDKIYKMIGQISEKDLSMLDERIKRAKRPVKRPETDKVSVKSDILNATVTHETNIEITDPESEDVNSSEEMPVNVTNTFETNIEPVKMVEQIKINGVPQPTAERPFGLLPDKVAEIEKDWIKADDIKLAPIIETDISFCFSPLKIKSSYGIPYPKEKFDKLLSRNANIVVPSHSHINFSLSPQQQNPQYTSNKVEQHTSIPESQLDPNLLKILNNLSSEDSILARAALNELNDILDSPEKQSVLRDYEEIYVKNIVQQFKYLSHQPTTMAVLFYLPILANVLTFFNTKTLGKNLNITSLMNLMSVLLGLMADQKLATVEDDNKCTKVINAICLKILDRANFTYTNCALIRLLKESCRSTGLPKFTDLLMKCIWRNVKVMPERANELNFPDVLYEVHEFMLALPCAWWQQRPSDTPLRTVKTIVHNMAKIKGNAILQDLNKIPSYSELHAYLLRVLKNAQKDLPPNAANVSPLRTISHSKEQSNRMSKHLRDSISQIFELISDKETSKEGLERLYQFKIDNPDVDIEVFLKDASPDFHKFIVENLAEIEKERQKFNKNTGNNENSSEQSTGHEHKILSSSSENTKDPEYYMERLLKLRKEGKIPTSGDNDQHMDNKVADENLNLNQLRQNFQTKSQFVKKELHSGLSPNRRELLQQKLSQFKQQMEN